jgi:hypothetical protein
MQGIGGGGGSGKGRGGEFKFSETTSPILTFMLVFILLGKFAFIIG